MAFEALAYDLRGDCYRSLREAIVLFFRFCFSYGAVHNVSMHQYKRSPNRMQRKCTRANDPTRISVTTKRVLYYAIVSSLVAVFVYLSCLCAFTEQNFYLRTKLIDEV